MSRESRSYPIISYNINIYFIELHFGFGTLWSPIKMGVFINWGILGHPQIIHFNGMFPYTPSILGDPHLWKPPNNAIVSARTRKGHHQRIHMSVRSTDRLMGCINNQDTPPNQPLRKKTSNLNGNVMSLEP